MAASAVGRRRLRVRPGKQALRLAEDEAQVIPVADQIARRFIALAMRYYAGELDGEGQAELVSMARKMTAGFGNELHLRNQRERVEFLTKVMESLVDLDAIPRVTEDEADRLPVDELLPLKFKSPTQRRQAIARELKVDVSTVRRQQRK